MLLFDCSHVLEQLELVEVVEVVKDMEWQSPNVQTDHFVSRLFAFFHLDCFP
jgi:hypothetical protein